MPNRIIRAGIISSDRVDMLDYAAEVFYRRLLNAVDDHGLYDARPSILRATLYPLRLDRVREADITRWLAMCEKAGLILLYEADSKPYLKVTNTQWESRSKPKYPVPSGKPPQPVSSCAQLQTDASNSEQLAPYSYSDSLSKTGANDPANFPDHSGITTALEEIYPGHSTSFKTIRGMFDLAVKLGATEQQVRNFPNWLKANHPKKADSPFAFKDLLDKSLKNGNGHLAANDSPKFKCHECQDTGSISVFAEGEFSHYADCPACQKQEAA